MYNQQFFRISSVAKGEQLRFPRAALETNDRDRESNRYALLGVSRRQGGGGGCTPVWFVQVPGKRIPGAASGRLATPALDDPGSALRSGADGIVSAVRRRPLPDRLGSA